MNKSFEQLLELSVAGSGTLFEAAHYALFSGGKRTRPHLTLAVAKALGGSEEKTLIPAAALELIHTYSLIHDDLPCMDDDALRRGHPTLHKKYDEATALLTGDFLLTKAFELLGSAEPDTAPLLARELAQAAGGKGMILGQMRDLYSTQTSLEALRETHHLKTGKLFEAAFVLGGISSHCSEKLHEELRLLGKHLGLAAQILNDLQDVEEGIDSDKRHGKTTYVTLLGIEGAANAYKEEMHLVEASLQQIPWENSSLTEALTAAYPSEHIPVPLPSASDR